MNKVRIYSRHVKCSWYFCSFDILIVKFTTLFVIFEVNDPLLFCKGLVFNFLSEYPVTVNSSTVALTFWTCNSIKGKFVPSACIKLSKSVSFTKISPSISMFSSATTGSSVSDLKLFSFFFDIINKSRNKTGTHLMNASFRRFVSVLF